MVWKNIVKPGDPHGVRVTAQRDGMLVQVVTAPMPSGFVEEGFLSSPHAAWASLGRHEVNQLIKALREARDRAFGRDE